MLTTLHHPHLVRGYEFVDGPTPMVSMETITGSTLDVILDGRTSRLPWLVIACLGEHLCAALQYLHRRNILHLDLKPGNIVSEAGKAKVLDLSLAHAPGRGPAGWGTPAYMAPEQADGGEFTTASDVWAVGLILYEAATGVQPFEPLDTPDEADAVSSVGSSPEIKYLQLQVRAEPVRKLRRLPAPLAAIIDRCLDPDPARRPEITELLGVLRSFLSPLITAETAA